MRRALLPLTMLGALACASASPRGNADAASASLVIVNVTVIDVANGSLRPNHTVVIAGNNIAHLEPSTSLQAASVRSVDGTGKYLIPGLIDMHSHVTSFGAGARQLYLAHGVTSVRDMGAQRFVESRAWRDSASQGLVLGPRMKIASPVVETAQWLAAIRRMEEAAGVPWRLGERFGPASPEDARRWVDSVARLGADHIKIRNWPTPEIVEAIVTRAREHGLPVVGHGAVPIPDGVSSIEHAVFPPLTRPAERRDSLWRAFAANGLVVVPTLVAHIMRQAPPDTLIARLSSGRVEGLRYVPAATREEWRDLFLGLKQERPLDWSALLAQMHTQLAEMRRAGMPILAGSDMGAPFVIPGFSLHDELERLVEELGLTPLEALQGATIAAARTLGVAHDRGTVEAGKLADLILLDANPLADIRHTRRIHSVVFDGRLLDRQAIAELLEEAEAAAR